MNVHHTFLWIVSTLVVLTIGMIHLEAILALFQPQSEVWLHIKENLLWTYIKNTLGVVFWSMLCSGIIGTALAYFVSCYQFPLRKLISILLYLPLAIPPYIGAYTYVNMLQPQGYVFNLFSGHVGVDTFWTAVFVFTAFLFPYVYISVQGFIRHGMSSYIENARLLKKSEWQIFIRVILPISKVSIITGVTFVGLEVLGDFGVVNYLGLQTFSEAIFKSWLGFRDLDSALRLSGIVIVFLFGILLVKGVLLRFAHQTATSSKAAAMTRKKLTISGMIFVQLFIWTTLTISLFLPLYRLITWAMLSVANIRWANFYTLVWNSTFYASMATAIILVLALMMATYNRTAPRYMSELYGRMTLISYAIPGPVIAIMVLFFILDIDDYFSLALSSTIAMLLLGYVVRYLGIAYENIENGYKKLGRKHHEVARTLGKSYYKTILTVDIPMLRPFILSATSLVFIDLLKELPLTLALRPFNFDTLATKTYQYANDEMLAESAIPSLVIIGISMCFIALIFYSRRRKS